MTTSATAAASKPPRRFRRQYLINPAFQWKYALVILPTVFVVSSFMTVFLFWILFNQARARMMYPGATSIWDNVLTFAGSAIGFSLLTAVAFGIWSIIVTHRICGPIFVMERYLREIAEGKFPRRRALRKKDEFKQLYEVLWNAIDALKAQQEDSLQTLTQAVEAANEASREGGKAQAAQLAPVISRLEVLRDRAAASLDKAEQGPAESSPRPSKADSPSSSELVATTA